MAFGFGGGSGGGFYGAPRVSPASVPGAKTDPNASLSQGGPAGSAGNDYEDPYWAPYQAETQQIEAGPGTPEEKAAAKKAAYDKYVASRNSDQRARADTVNKTGGDAENDAWRQYMSFGGPRFDEFGNQLSPSAFTQGKQNEMSGYSKGSLDNSMMYANTGNQALNRTAPTLDTSEADRYAKMGDTDRLLQTNAGWALLTGANDAMGPSAAEQMLKQQSGRTMQQNLAMARSGRGAGYSPAAMRAAQFANAQQQNQLGTSLAAARAQEVEAYKQRQLQGLEAAARAGAMAREGDLAAQTQGFNQQKTAAEIEQEQQRINNTLFKDAGVLGMGWQEIGQGWERQGFDYGQSQSDLAKDILAIQQGQYSAAADRGQQQQAGLIGAGATIAGSLISASDRRAKRNVAPVSEDELLTAERRSDPRSIRVEYPTPRQPMVDDFYAPAMPRRSVYPELEQPDFAALDAAYASDRRAKRRLYASDIDTKRDVRLEELDEAAAGVESDIRRPRAVYPTMGRRGGDDALMAELDAAGGAADTIRGTRATYPALDTVRSAPGYSFEYKDPERHGEGRFYGPMAQDLEQTPAGRSTIKKAPDGTKMVDTGRLALVNTAALNEQQSQMDELDAELERMRRVFGQRATYPEIR